MLTRKSDFAGICPACGKAVYHSEPDGPVWTCPADLNEANPYWEPLPEDWQTSEAQMERDGYYANCPEGNFARPSFCPFEAYGAGHLPLHSECYDKGDY
jgi:hypothetical protein